MPSSSLHEPALPDERGLGLDAPPSVVDGLGGEVVAVVAPVALCIGATVGLVRALNPDGGAGGGGGVYWAAAAYREDVSVGGSGGRRGTPRGGVNGPDARAPDPF